MMTETTRTQESSLRLFGGQRADLENQVITCSRSNNKKMTDNQKITVTCLECEKKLLHVPSVAKTRKFCSRQCACRYRTGRPHLNFNPGSIHKRSGSGVCGEYRGIRFRSTYELSFLVRASELRHSIVAEPVRIRMSDFLSKREREGFGVHEFQVYIPDYLVNNKSLVEIKPEYMIGLESAYSTLNWAKIIVLSRYSEKNNLDSWILTDDMMGENLLKDKQIAALSNVVFYKKKHSEKYESIRQLDCN